MRTVIAVVVALAGALCARAATTPSALPPAPRRPGGEAGPTEMRYAVRIGDITHIDGVAQTFAANLLLILRWRDPQLAHAGPGVKQYAIDDIWHPRLLIVNEADNVVRSLPEIADVAADGTVTYRQRFIGSYAQSLNLRAFPFDSDTFRVQLVILGYRPEELKFVPAPEALAAGIRDGISIAEKLTIQEWRILSTTVKTPPYEVAPGLGVGSLSLEFTAERRAHHFVIKVIIPLILIVAMSWAVFWIEPNDTATQVGVSITAMLTLIAYRFAVDSDVPKLPYLTKLDAFILTSTVLVFLSLIEVMFTTKFANRDRTELARAIDRRCLWIFPLVFAASTTIIFLR